MSVCVRVCVYGCVRACVTTCVRVRVCVCETQKSDSLHVQPVILVEISPQSLERKISVCCSTRKKVRRILTRKIVSTCDRTTKKIKYRTI